MIDYQSITLDKKQAYEQVLSQAGERGCEYSFANLYLWGRQRMAFLHGNVTVFSQYDRKSVYLFPIGNGDLKATLESIIDDANTRDIPCRLTGLFREDCDRLEQLFPGKFRVHTDRNSFDYIYAVEDLAELTGRRFQKKRNHLNRFRQCNPNAVTEPITAENREEVLEMVCLWYELRLQEDPTLDFHMERAAFCKAMQHQQELGMEGLLLRVDGKIAAMTLGSRLSQNTFDVHFEKALEKYDGAYPAINQAFARYIRQKYPEVTLLNREDDMGIEGLRKAKMSYNPSRFREKYWACLLEDGYDY